MWRASRAVAEALGWLFAIVFVLGAFDFLEFVVKVGSRADAAAHSKCSNEGGNMGISNDAAPRITPADVEAHIVGEYYFTAAHGVLGARTRGELIVSNPAEVSGPGAEMLTFCVLQLRNGTRIVGTNYGAIDPARHSAERGRADARAQAVEQIWPLLGYELRSKLTANA